MIAVREQIFAVIETRLRSIADVAEVERMPSGDPISFPALHIFDGGQDGADSTIGATGYALSIAVEGYVEQGSGPSVHAQLSALYADVVRVLMPEPPLDGLAETIDERNLNVWVAGQASERRMAFALTFDITFFANRGDPALSA